MKKSYIKNILLICNAISPICLTISCYYATPYHPTHLSHIEKSASQRFVIVNRRMSNQRFRRDIRKMPNRVQCQSSLTVFSSPSPPSFYLHYIVCTSDCRVFQLTAGLQFCNISQRLSLPFLTLSRIIGRKAEIYR